MSAEYRTQWGHQLKHVARLDELPNDRVLAVTLCGRLKPRSFDVTPIGMRKIGLTNQPTCPTCIHELQTLLELEEIKREGRRG